MASVPNVAPATRNTGPLAVRGTAVGSRVRVEGEVKGTSEDKCCPSYQHPIEVYGGAYEGEVGEGLGEVPQRLPGRSYLLGIESKVVGV